MSALVELEDAAFGYAGRVVVRAHGLAVRPGEFLGLVGASGAGKTTLFRGLLGLVPPLAGRVKRAGAVFGYVPQRETLDELFPLSALEVVEMGACGRRTGLRAFGRDERAAAHAALARVGLGPEARAPFAELSGGQRQRVLIARALLARPTLLLLDEPTSAVDQAAERRILALLRELNEREGLAILLVSHNLALVREAVALVWTVRDGGVEVAPPGEALGARGLERLFGGAGAAGATGG